jgi:uncharacterized protein (DUF1330 family)
MPAYVIVQIEVTYQVKFARYLKEMPAIVATAGGRYIARGGKKEVFEGTEGASRVVIIEFPSLEKAREWYYSEDYKKVKELRADAARGSIIAVEGL